MPSELKAHSKSWMDEETELYAIVPRDVEFVTDDLTYELLNDGSTDTHAALPPDLYTEAVREQAKRS